MKKIASIISLLVLVAGCDTNQQDTDAAKAQLKADSKTVEANAERHTMRVANNVRDQTKKTAAKLREWWLEPLPELATPVVPPSYCYKVMQDIICYRQPMPGMAHQLVGVQGENTAKPVTQMTALPKVKNSAITQAGKPEERIKTAKPVFVSIPTQAKADTTGSAADEAAMLGNEPLPNPMLSPQL